MTDFVARAAANCAGAYREWAERTGHPLALVASGLAEGVRRGLIDADPARIVATEAGQRFLNTTLQMFLPAAAREAPVGDAPVAVVEA